jgi:hypothetical protein
MATIYSNGDNRWNILGFNFTKRDALSSVYKISMAMLETLHDVLFVSLSIRSTLVSSCSNYLTNKTSKNSLERTELLSTMNKISLVLLQQHWTNKE